MKFAARSRSAPDLPGTQGPARVERRLATLMPRLRAGDIAVCDAVDLDRTMAQRLVDAGVAGVVSAGPMISGRYPNLGPQVLVDAGITVIDDLGPAVFDKVKDGRALRLRGAALHCGEDLELTGRELDAPLVQQLMEQARSGMGVQLDHFTHNSTEFLRREQDLLLHGHGVPRIATAVAGRSVVVVVRSHDWEAELRGIRAFLREQNPVLVAVDRGADALASKGLRADIVLVTAGAELPTAKVLRKARDVVVLTDRGADPAVLEPLQRLNLRPVKFETGATAEDAALLLAAANEPRLIVGVGMHALLDEFLDRGRAGLASTFLTRLRLGPMLVDASAVPTLYDGAVRPRHVLATGIAGLVALATAIAVTPVGQDWVQDVQPAMTSLIDHLRGLLP